jgi:RNA polymerase-binding transcription factor DksA
MPSPTYFDQEQQNSADALDRASQLEEQQRSARINETRQAAAPETHPDFDGIHCVADGCGVVIPEARRALGKVRCIDCQQELEDRRKLIGRR